MRRTKAARCCRRRPSLLDVLPERRVEPPGDHREDAEEDQHPHPDANPRILRRLAHPLQVVDEITHGLVVLEGRHGTRSQLLPPLEDLGFVSVALVFLEDRAAIALQLPQCVGHADAGECEVVPARGLGVVAVERAQESVEVVRPGAVVAGARAGDHGEVGRVGAEPVLGLPRIDGGLHGLAHLVGGEEQVVLDLLVGQADVLQAVVAHEGGRVAAQAVVDEDLGAVLQRGRVVRAHRGLVPGDAAFRGVRAQGEPERGDQREDDFFHGRRSGRLQCAAKVTRSGTGFGSPRRLHHGMSRKKPK